MMNGPSLKLKNPPIVEAVVDIDCDLSPGATVEGLETAARDAFREMYPKFRTRLKIESQIEHKLNAEARVSSSPWELMALQFLRPDEKQLIQVRDGGFSFNRLSPYSTLDDYIPEVVLAWKSYVSVAKPPMIRSIRLRYINRILLPEPKSGAFDTSEFLALGPRLPDADNMLLTGFLHQYTVVERTSGHQARTVLAAQAPIKGVLPVILDISVVAEETHEPPDDVEWIKQKIQSLRHLKNRIFRETLTESCLNLFQQ